MKPAAFSYHTPRSLQECLALLAELAELGEDAAPLAGGQSLVPLMRFRLAQPAHVISLRGLDELHSIRIVGDDLVIGARVSYREVQRSPDALRACPGLAKAIALIATPAVRSRGTICGNLCQADPASELPALALVMQARFRLRSQAGDRLLSAAEFFLGPYTTARRGDELLTEVLFPLRPAAERVAIQEVARLRGGFPMAGVAVALTRGAGTAFESIAIACFAAHPVQVRVASAEAALRARGCTPAGLDEACRALAGAIEPHADAFASAEYRRAAACTLLRRAVEDAWRGEEGAR